jgi:hypothetical protein
MRYRHTVLEPGGSMSANDLVRNFLGREQNMDALQKWMGQEFESALCCGRSRLASHSHAWKQKVQNVILSTASARGGIAIGKHDREGHEFTRADKMLTIMSFRGPLGPRNRFRL